MIKFPTWLIYLSFVVWLSGIIYCVRLIPGKILLAYMCAWRQGFFEASSRYHVSERVLSPKKFGSRKLRNSVRRSYFAVTPELSGGVTPAVDSLGCYQLAAPRYIFSIDVVPVNCV